MGENENSCPNLGGLKQTRDEVGRLALTPEERLVLNEFDRHFGVLTEYTLELGMDLFGTEGAMRALLGAYDASVKLSSMRPVPESGSREDEGAWTDSLADAFLVFWMDLGRQEKVDAFPLDMEQIFVKGLRATLEEWEKRN